MTLDTRALVTRETPDPAKVARYRAALRAGSTPPPLAVMRYDAKRWLLIDGHHRLKAARTEGRLYVDVEVVSLSK